MCFWRVSGWLGWIGSFYAVNNKFWLHHGVSLFFCESCGKLFRLLKLLQLFLLCSCVLLDLVVVTGLDYLILSCII